MRSISERVALPQGHNDSLSEAFEDELVCMIPFG